MKKEETKELVELSMQAFGKKYAYKRLLSQGLVVGRDKEHSFKVRRTPLTPLQVKNYMLGLLKQREEK